MKKTHIALLVMVAVGIGIIVSMFGDFSTYETFASASKQPGKPYHIIGFWIKAKVWTIIPLLTLIILLFL